MSYCTASDTCSLFPKFVRNQAGSIADNQIQGWLDDASARIHAAFMQRGLDVDNLTHPYLRDPSFTVAVVNQQKLLREWCRAYGVWKLGDAIQGALSSDEQALTKTAREWWAYSFKAITTGDFDKEFAGSLARTTDLTPGFTGIAGAEMPTDDVVNPRDNGTYFAKWIVYLWPLVFLGVEGWRWHC